MQHWLQAVVAVAGALASWRWVLRPIARGYRELLGLLKQIRDASGGVQHLALEVQALAGAVTHFVIANQERLTALESRQADVTEILVDALADLARLQRTVAEHHPEGEAND
jgi:HAMP domain-containing protein